MICLILLPPWAVSDDGRPGEDPVFDAHLSSALQEELEKVREMLGSPNISASVYISDRCHWVGAAGATRQDPDVPVDAAMLYGFGSITKTFVAGIVLQLAEEGRLRLEDPLARWLPHYPNIDAGTTIRELLNHGSGLDDFVVDASYRSDVRADPGRVWSPEETLKYVGPPPAIGSAPPIYSNTNYILLGMIIEAATANTLERELQGRITGPLRLNSTYLPRRDFEPERWADSTKLSSASFTSVWAAGAIASTPREIAKWSHALYSGSFLGDASMREMLTTEPRRIGRRTLPMGLGVWKLGSGSKVAWGHGGRLFPFKSAALYVPELGIGIASSFSWTDSGEQLLPVTHLLRVYGPNRPDDISMCFD